MKRSVAALYVLLCAVRMVDADGVYFPKTDTSARYAADITEPEQKAAIIHYKGLQRMILQVSFVGSADEFAWLVPTPSVPEVTACKQPVFHTLQQATAPRIRYWFNADQHIQRLEAARGPSSEKKLDVEVVDRKQIGVYDVTVLRAKNAADLLAWLHKHSYRTPPKSADVVDVYIKKGWVFTAMRINTKDSRSTQAKLEEGVLQSLAFTFRTPNPVYPLTISSLNPGGSKILLYVFSQYQTSAAGFHTVSTYNNWTDQYARTLRDRELIFTLLEDERSFGHFADLFFSSKPVWMTKLSADLKAADMKQDMVFVPSRSQTVVEDIVSPPIIENLGALITLGIVKGLANPYAAVVGVLLVFVGMLPVKGGPRPHIAIFGALLFCAHPLMIIPLEVMKSAGYAVASYSLAIVAALIFLNWYWVSHREAFHRSG